MSTKRPHLMSDAELQRAADDCATRIAHGTATIRDSAIVIELANRLHRKS